MTTPRLAQNVRGKGRHYAHPLSGDLLPSVTNVIGCLDKPALVGWAAREVAGAAWDARFSLVKVPERDMAVDMLKGTPYKKRDKRADVGTVVHSLAEALATDSELPSFTDEEQSYADGFLQWVSDFDVTFLMSEVTVFNRTFGYAGTADALVDIAGMHVLVDFKTNASGVWPETALQLAALANAEEYAQGDTVRPWTPPDRCAALHLQPRAYGHHPISNVDAAFRCFASLVPVWQWHKGGGSEGCISAPLAAPEVAA